jgi:hypothetical protein
MDPIKIKGWIEHGSNMPMLNETQLIVNIFFRLRIIEDFPNRKTERSNKINFIL